MILPVFIERIFPRLKDRGPIEAILVKSKCVLAREFPRLKNRGPIEATRVGVLDGRR